MDTDPRTTATAYFTAWLAEDFTTVRGLLDDGVTFRGPMGTADDADTALQGLRGKGS